MPFECNSCTLNLPKSTGPYDVGTTDLMWGVNADGNLITLYYPTLPNYKLDGYKRKPWSPEPSDKYFEGDMKSTLMFDKASAIEKWISKLLFDRMRTQAFTDAPLAGDKDYSTSPQYSLKNMPVLIFSHGLASNRAILTALCSEFASYGYVVAAVEHRDGSASYTYYISEDGEMVDIPHKYLKTNGDYEDRNRQVNQRAKECSKTIDILEKLQKGEHVKNLLKTSFDLSQFKNRLNISSVGIFGHSFGGATVTTALAKDQRFTCGIALDPWMFPIDHDLHHKFNKPLYVLNAYQFSWPFNITQIQHFLDKDNTENADRKLFTIRDTYHADLTDYPLLLPFFLANQTAKVGTLSAPLKGIVMNKMCFDFFEKYLSNSECNRYRGANINPLDYAFEGTNVDVIGHENEGKDLDVLNEIFRY